MKKSHIIAFLLYEMLKTIFSKKLIWHNNFLQFKLLIY